MLDDEQRSICGRPERRTNDIAAHVESDGVLDAWQRSEICVRCRSIVAAGGTRIAFARVTASVQAAREACVRLLADLPTDAALLAGATADLDNQLGWRPDRLACATIGPLHGRHITIEEVPLRTLFKCLTPAHQNVVPMLAHKAIVKRVNRRLEATLAGEEVTSLHPIILSLRRSQGP